MLNSEIIKIQRYHKYKAVISVTSRSTLKPDAVLNDGEIIYTEALWMIDEGPFQGQFAMSLPEHTGYIWCPQEDLIILEEIPPHANRGSHPTDKR